MPIDKSFIEAVHGHLAGMEKADSGGGEGGKEKEASYAAPEKYSPSTPEQRANWNKFLNYLSEKGVAGSEELDKRDKSRGLQYLREYNKANPKNAVDESFIPTVQYEKYLISQKQQFPGLDPAAAKYAFDSLASKGKPVSPVDSWLGSLTSKEYYPSYSRGTSVNKPGGINETTGQYDFGTNFEDYYKSLSDQKLADKYRIKQESPPVASK